MRQRGLSTHEVVWDVATIMIIITEAQSLTLNGQEIKLEAKDRERLRQTMTFLRDSTLRRRIDAPVKRSVPEWIKTHPKANS